MPKQYTEFWNMKQQEHQNLEDFLSHYKMVGNTKQTHQDYHWNPYKQQTYLNKIYKQNCHQRNSYQSDTGTPVTIHLAKQEQHWPFNNRRTYQPHNTPAPIKLPWTTMGTTTAKRTFGTTRFERTGRLRNLFLIITISTNSTTWTSEQSWKL